MVVKCLTEIKIVFQIIRIYILWYGFVLILSYWNPYNLNVVSSESYLLHILGYTSLIIGFLVHPSIKAVGLNKNSVINIDFAKTLFFKISVFSSLVITLMVLEKFLSISALLPKDARDLYFDGMANATSIPLFKYLWPWFIPVVVFVVQTFLASILISKSRISKFWIFIFLILVIGNILIGFGRGPVQKFLYIFILLFVMQNAGYINFERDKTKEVLKKRRSLVNLFAVFLISIILIGLITSLRGITDGGSGEDNLIDIGVVVKQFVVYSTGGIAAFDYGVSNSIEYNFGPLYGSGAFASIDNLFYFINYNPDYANNILGRYLQERRIGIGASYEWNYAYTMFFVFFKDLGIFGLMLYPFLLGFFFKRVIMLFLKTNNFFYLCIVVYLSYCLFYSNFAYLLQSVAAFFIIFFLIVSYNLSKLKL